MPKGLIIALFLVIIAPLGLIVWWEFRRAQCAPRSVARAFKLHLDTQAGVLHAAVRKEAKRGFDAWDWAFPKGWILPGIARNSTISQNYLWTDFRPRAGSAPVERHPCVAVQSDLFNRSGLTGTVTFSRPRTNQPPTTKAR